MAQAQFLASPRFENEVPPLEKLAPTGTGGASYIGRFAPSPTGPLHAGSLVAALASWLDAKAHGGLWLVRIEDVDAPRCIPNIDQVMLDQLQAFGLIPDAPPWFQSQRRAVYQSALDDLIGRGQAYPCTCTRKGLAQALAALGLAQQRHGELVYPGTCRRRLGQAQSDNRLENASWRLQTGCSVEKRPNVPVVVEELDTVTIAGKMTDNFLHWQDRRLGKQQQDVENTVGDFVLKRADGCFTYQLAVVVDDAAQGITHVVRGEDLADNTARQILLQHALGLATPVYLHTPLVLGTNGEKLSKQNGAQALDATQPLVALNTAARALRLQACNDGPQGGGAASLGDALLAWVAQWRGRYAALAS